MIAASEKGEVVGSLASYEIEEEVDEVDSTFGNVVGQESLTRFDEAKRKRRRNKRKPKGKSGGQSSGQAGPRSLQGFPRQRQGSKDDAGKKPSRNRNRNRNRTAAVAKVGVAKANRPKAPPRDLRTAWVALA